MDDFDDGPRKGSEPSLPSISSADTPCNDGKKSNSGASAATAKTPEVGNGEDCNKSQSGVGTTYSVDFEAQPTQGNEATPESSVLMKNEESSQGKSADGSLGSLSMKAPQRDVVAVQDGETKIGFSLQTPGFTNDGDGDRAVSQGLAAAQRRLPDPHALQQRSERSVPSVPEANTDQQGLLVEFAADDYYLMQIPNLGLILERLHRENHRQSQKTDEVLEKLNKLLSRQDDNDKATALLTHDNTRLRQETEQLQDKVEQLSKDLNGAVKNLQSVLEERHAGKRANEELRARVRLLSNDLQDCHEENERLVQDAKKREKELEEFMWQHSKEMEKTKAADERLAQNWCAKECEVGKLEERVSQLNKRLKDIQEVNERQKQETLAEKSAKEGLQERVRQLEKEREKERDVAKQYQPKNEQYLLDPFTGYAIVVSNAIFEKGEHGTEKLVDDDTKSALREATTLAKALFDYGFEVKPMKNPTRAVLRDALVECDQRWEQANLVLIFIIAHGNSAGFEVANSAVMSQREVAQAFLLRQTNGKPTILCMATCREIAEGDLDLLPHELKHVFLVNAVRLGFKTSLEDNKRFVAALVKIFHLSTGIPRSFLAGIDEMGSDSYTELDSYTRLLQPLVLPAYPAKNRTKEEEVETYKKLEKAFKYAS